MEPSDDPGVCSGSPPAIARRGPRRRAWLVDTPYEVWEVVAVLERRGSPGAVASETGLTERQVRLALEFWERYPEEIDAALAEEGAPVKDAGGAGPGPGTLEAPELVTIDGGASEARRLLERVPFSDAQRRHLAELLDRWQAERG